MITTTRIQITAPTLRERGTKRNTRHRSIPWIVMTGAWLIFLHSAWGVTRYVNGANTTPASPYTSWASAASNIQDAVDAAVAGDLILVTNGIYATGARDVYGMSNRVAVTKALTVQSVNGPEVTTIGGYQMPGTTNGAAAIRCVYLTNGAVLSGFTLTNGATQTSGNYLTNRSGGGAWCESAGAILTNCMLMGNSAYNSGGGSYRCTLNNCTLAGNSASQYGGGTYYGTLNNCMLTGNFAPRGGGSFYGTLTNCALTGNSATIYGGGSYEGTLNNCTLTGNFATNAGGVFWGTLNNCIVYYNNSIINGSNYYNSIMHNCCTTPFQSDCITTVPLLASASHLSASSPCRGAGSAAYTSGLDIDGEPWANPPSIGCDEYWSGSVTGAVSVAITASSMSVIPGTRVDLQAVIGGRVSSSRWDFGDGVTMSNQPYASHAWAEQGDYMVELRAWNETYPSGVVATIVVHVRWPVHYVAMNSASPLPPYSSWATAATNIQDAVDSASVAGAWVLVSNGVYETRGRMVFGTSNRLAVTKAVTVQSVNGPGVTIIRGYQVPGTTNGAAAIRCVYLTNGAVLSGFTLTNGATPTSGIDSMYRSGGGVWCESKGAILTNCVLRGNSAFTNGGGAYRGTLNNCVLTGNSACVGGGGFSNTLNNCAISGNSALFGGGACFSTLTNCTLTGNSAFTNGGGAYSCALNNCIAYDNTSGAGGNNYHTNSTLSYCCTTPMPAGSGNITNVPLLASGSLLSANSPCRGAGSAFNARGRDIDGESWANPPSIGCDEYWSGSVTGSVSVAISTSSTNVYSGISLDFHALIDGRVSMSRWDFGDGVTISNQPYASHAWTEQGDYVVELRAWNETYPSGVAATIVIHVNWPVHYVAVNSLSPEPPYLSWATAATNIQDAVDSASVMGALIWVSNGVYETGSRVVYGMSNRVAVTKAVTVQSVNGPEVTIIRGCQVPGKTNGATAIRCVYLTNGAVLSGFTLTNGATQTSKFDSMYRSGGGAWGESVGAILTNCMLTGNSSICCGGGSYRCTLNNCTLAGNSASDGGGSCESTLNNCTLAGNSAYYGGGAYYGILNNCTLTGNSASCGGGAYYGIFNNCTLTGNSANDAGGAYYGTFNNCIVYYNTAVRDGANYSRSTMDYCCTMPMPTGTGNITNAPLLASASRLSASSPCRGAGNVACTSGLDIDGESWANPPSIGCDEYYCSGSATGTVSVAITATSANVIPGISLVFQAMIGGRASDSRWDFGDGVTVSNQLYTSHAWAAPGDYVVELRACNETYPSGVAATIVIHVVSQPVHYVALNSQFPVPPYSSWSTAATNIQDAVDAASVVGSLVLVSNGVYESGARNVYGMSNRVAVTKAVTVQSVNGPEVTSIRGYQDPSTTNGTAAIRCAYLTNGAVLSGFTLTHGATPASANNLMYLSGGGVWCESRSAVLNNCMLTGNSADCYGGGSYYGTLNNCTLAGNSASDGGGSCESTLINCTLTGNSANYGYGGGAYYGAFINCIAYYNTAVSGGANFSGSTMNYCCTIPMPAGTGNTTNEPLFVNTNGWIVSVLATASMREAEEMAGWEACNEARGIIDITHWSRGRKS